MLKHVCPSTATASIPDPDRGGFLPVEGRVVAWTPYWAGMMLREEIVVSAAPDEAEPAPAVAEVAPEAAPTHRDGASVEPTAHEAGETHPAA